MNNSPSVGSAWLPIAIALVCFVSFFAFITWGVIKFLAERRGAKNLANLGGHRVVVRITDRVLPMERGAKYVEPLQQALRSKGLGFVTGGGTQMSRDGSSIEWVSIELELSNVDGALAFTRDVLRELGAPAGSDLEYQVGDRKIGLPIG